MRLKELRRAHVYRHFAFEWAFSYKFPFSFFLFPLENATFAIFPSDSPMMPTKHFWKVPYK